MLLWNGTRVRLPYSKTPRVAGTSSGTSDILSVFVLLRHLDAAGPEDNEIKTVILIAHCFSGAGSDRRLPLFTQ